MANEFYPLGSFFRTRHGAFVKSRVGSRGGPIPVLPIPPTLVLVGGLFTIFQGSIKYLTSWNEILAAWAANGTFNARVTCIQYHPGLDVIIVGGWFTTVNGVTTGRLVQTTDGVNFTSLNWNAAWQNPAKIIVNGNDFLVLHEAWSPAPPRVYSGGSWSQLGTSYWRYYAAYSTNTGLIYVGSNILVAGYDGYNYRYGFSVWNSGYWRDIAILYESGYDVILYNGEPYCSSSGYMRKWLGTYGGSEADFGPSLGDVKAYQLIEFDGVIVGRCAASPYLVFTDGVVSWATYAGGTNGSIKAMAVINNRLYIVGDFTEVGSPAVSAPYAAYFDGTIWHSMGTGPGNAYAVGGKAP